MLRIYGLFISIFQKNIKFIYKYILKNSIKKTIFIFKDF